MFSNPPCVEWEDVVSLVNPDTNRVTCVGYAASQGRRCRNPKKRDAVGRAHGILANMEPLEDGINGKTQEELYKIASLTLCHRHCHQTMDVASTWERRAEKAIARLCTPPPCRGQFHYAAKTERDEVLHEVLELLKQLQETFQGNSASQQRPGAWTQPPPKHQNFNTFDHNPFTPPCPEPKSFNFHFNFGNNSDHREPKDSSWHEPDQKTRTTTGFFTPPPTPPPSPPSPPKRTPVEPRLAIKAAPKPVKKTDRQVWDEIWVKYLADWACLDGNLADMDVKVPWPTKSGKLEDVTEENVRKFFREGPCHGLKSGEEWCFLMRAETLRWHTDKITARFGPAALEKHKEVFGLIVQQVIAMRKESIRNRHQM